MSVVAERIFRDTFAAGNDADEIDRYCAGAFSADIQAREIAEPNALTLLVEAQDELVAFAQLAFDSPNHAAGAQRPATHLQRLYVDREWHGTGLARDIMDTVVGRAVESGAGELWLAVWERNDRAIAFYRKVGFTVAGEQSFQLGNELQRDLVMVRSLRPGQPPDG